MLAWCCDLIVAADDAYFAEVTATRMGLAGGEYFAHSWELGARKAKELLLTGDSIDAEEAYRLGMVSKVFRRAELEERTIEFARRIAQLPSITSLIIKDAVNQTQDIQGFSNALSAAFSLHQVNHSHWSELTGFHVAVPGQTGSEGYPDPRVGPSIRPSARDRSGAAG